MSCQLLHLDELKRKHSCVSGLLQRRIKFAWAAKQIIAYCGKRVMRTVMDSPRDTAERTAVAELNVGDLVRVLSKEEIEKTLDAWGQYKGCTFIPEMYQYCDQRYRVLKKVEHFYDEVKQKGCTCRDVVFLKYVTCSGKRKIFPQPCDRNCFLFWRTVWLKKIEDDA